MKYKMNFKKNLIQKSFKNNKILRDKFKELKDLYNENQKTLVKEIKEHIYKWKDIPFMNWKK